MGHRRTRPDDWLGLVPEVERLVPELVGELAGPEVGTTVRVEIEDLIRRGDAVDWLDFLARLAAWVPAETRGREGGGMVLAEILRDQYRLAPGVLDLAARDEEMSAVLERVTAR